MENIKKARSSNFSKEEELCLLQEIAKFKNIVECKTTNKFTNTEKDEAWQKILNAFNSKSMETRSLAQIKSKYDHFKTRSKKEVAKEKAYLKGTGGGPSIIKELDPIVEATLNIINLKTVVGFPNILDDDFTLENESIEHALLESELKPSIPDSQLILFETIKATDIGSASIESEVMIMDKVLDSNHEENIEVNIQPASSNSQLHTPCKPAGKRKYESLTEPQHKKSDWSQYVPNNLRKVTNKKLRPTAKNPTFVEKELYYKTKTELLKKTFECEENDRIRRIEREEEEHKKNDSIRFRNRNKKKQLNQ